MEIKLKECPFCGKLEFGAVELKAEFIEDKWIVFVGCRNCGARGPIVVKEMFCNITSRDFWDCESCSKAIEAWNKRA